MNEKPINLRDWQVRAILDGTKAQHRVVLKPLKRDKTSNNPYVMWPVYDRGRRCGSSANPDRASAYTPGQIFWVRETWFPMRLDSAFLQESTPVLYKADGFVRHFSAWGYADYYDKPPMGKSWRSPVTMPRWASRITLRVTAVRVERVAEISNSDAVAEGCPGWYSPCHPDEGTTDGRLPHEEFYELWDSINGKRPGCSWDDNPWVVALSFERVTP